MEKITYSDLSGQLKFAAWGAIVNAYVLALLLGAFALGIVMGIFGW